MSTTSDNASQTAPVLPEMIPLCEPYLQGNEWAYVRECLDSGWVSSVGSFVNRFESHVADYTGTKYAVATVNGTSALHAALLSVGVLPEDEVLVSTLTFIASANAIHYTGAHPVFIDAEPNYWQIDPHLVAEFLSQHCVTKNGVLRNRSTGRRIAAIMPVHILGHPAEINDLIELARRYDLAVVEDAAESLGAEYQGKRLGGFGDATCFSFNGNKSITSGAGGMVVTNSARIAERTKYLTTQAKDDPFEYEHHEIGFNYRMSNVLAALGLAQLEQLDTIIAKKREIADAYRTKIQLPGITWHREDPRMFSTYWLSTALIDPAKLSLNAIALREKLQSQGVQARRLWRPMHTNPPYAGCQKILTGVADSVADNALSFPSSASLTEDQQLRVCETILQQLQD